jgi:uncharacterized protein YbjT (DUF2867 family)
MPLVSNAILAIVTSGVLAFAGCAAKKTVEPGGVLVFGGAGRTGAEIVRLLLSRGESVTVFVRPTSDRTRLMGMNVAFAIGDAMNRAEVEAAFAESSPRVAINAIGGRGSQAGFWDTTQRNITAAAKRSATTEVIFLSSVGVGDSAIAYTQEALIRNRASLAERLVAEDDLKASGLAYVIIRTGRVVGEDIPATGQARLTEDRTAMGVVNRADLARLTVDCITNARCRNRTFASIDDSLTVTP